MSEGVKIAIGLASLPVIFVFGVVLEHLCGQSPRQHYERERAARRR